MSTKAERRFYSSARWRKTRLQVIARDEGLCVICRKHGRLTIGKEVDHIKPMKERPDLALRMDNLRLLCHACHVSVTAAHARPTPTFCLHGYREMECPICKEINR